MTINCPSTIAMNICQQFLCRLLINVHFSDSRARCSGGTRLHGQAPHDAAFRYAVPRVAYNDHHNSRKGLVLKYSIFEVRLRLSDIRN